MKILSSAFAILISLLGGTVLSVEVVYCQPRTVNYTITEWNASGSFTFEAGMAQNPSTNQLEGYVRMVTSDNEVIEINPQVLGSLITQLETGTPSVPGTPPSISKNTTAVAAQVAKLRDLKAAFEDQTRMQNIINQLQSGAALSSFNWSYVLSTIRGLQAHINGTIN